MECYYNKWAMPLSITHLIIANVIAESILKQALEMFRIIFFFRSINPIGFAIVGKFDVHRITSDDFLYQRNEGKDDKKEDR